jgi:phage terminase large subunit-like protein
MSDNQYYTDLSEPNKIRKFFSTFLIHSKGIQAGKPFQLLPWQNEIVDALFGTYNSETRYRRYRRALVLIPKKNGKSTLMAGLCLYQLLFGEASGEIVAVANSREQAKIILDATKDFIFNSKELSKRLIISKNTIYNKKLRTTFKIISRDANTAQGMNSSFVIYDELFGAPSSELYDNLVSGMVARKQPLLIAISTAGYDKASFLYDLCEHGKKVNSGAEKDDTFYAKLYGIEEGEDWKSEEVWKKCNPSLGHTIPIEALRADFKSAVAFPRGELSFRTNNLNDWIDSMKHWIGDTQWMECGADVKIEDFKGETCYAGLDLSSTTDLTALVLCFYRNEKYYVFSFAFCPEENIKGRSRKDKVPYDMWRNQSHLIATPGNATDYDYIIKKLNDLSKDYNISAVAIDRWNSTFLSTKLMADGFNVIGFGQGFSSMSSPVKALERLVLSKNIIHDNNPILRWCLSNVILQVDAAGNAKCSKAESKERIDLIIALLMALDECGKHNFAEGTGNVSWV